jgi:lipoyl(octanoyl) transferase
MLDLNQRGRDVRHFVHSLEGWLIDTLADLGVAAWRAEGRVGIWTKTRTGQEAKIGAIGIRVRKWVTMHGFAINIAPDLSHFAGIVPCGIAEYPVTSLHDLGLNITMAQFDSALQARCDGFLRTLQQ